MTDMFPQRLRQLAMLVSDEARQRRLKIAVAESCTGGLLGGLLTDIPGSSDVFERGFITYTNKSKQEVLGVPGDLIADVGAVSESVARFMAEGALAESRANVAAAVTGIAGPGGGTPMKPVGTVHIAAARENRAVRHELCQFGEIGRQEVRLATLEAVLHLLDEMIKD